MQKDQKHIIITTEGRTILTEEKEFCSSDSEFCLLDFCSRFVENKKVENSV